MWEWCWGTGAAPELLCWPTGAPPCHAVLVHLARRLTPGPWPLPPRPHPCSYLVIKRPWPSMMRTVAGDHARFEQTYFSHYKGYYFTGDGARRDEDG